MRRMKLVLGFLEENCTIFTFDGRAAYVVDPGAEAQRILDALRERNLSPEAILLTHAHFDHVGAIPELLAAHPGLKVAVDEPERMLFGHPKNAYPPVYNEVELPKTAVLPEAAGVPGMKVIRTPGHTPGGVCYHFPEEKLLFSGDTLFAGAVGRTDLPGGNAQTLMKSLELLKALPPETTVVPGHGPETTIGRELADNPFLGEG